jgi:large subunit ribosomal protein L22
MATDIHATMRYVSASAQKVRLVCDMVRNRSANDALNVLRYTPKNSARILHKLLTSAVSNAEENFGVSRDNLYIYKIFADEAPTRKWRRFGARGRFKPLLRRSSHITVILREQE